MPTLAVAIDARAAKVGATQADSAFRKVKTGAKQTSNEMGRFQKQTNGVGNSLKALAGPLAGVFGTLSLALAFRRSISVMKDFEQAMRTVQGVTRATAEEFELLEIQARKMGATTRFSATEAAEGLLFLSRAGFDAQQGVAALPATLNLAVAGAIGLGEAADFASNILKQFNLDVAETERVTDVLVNTANSANTDVRQLADAMKFAGPIANTLGQSMEETAAQIGALGDAGIQGGQAGTNLRGVMLALANPTTDAMKAFEGLGLSLEQLNPATNNLTDILQSLTDAGLTAGEAARIFGRRNAAAALILGKSAETVRELTKANQEAGGEAQRVADIMDDSLNGALLELKSTIEEAILTLGDSGFGKALRNTVEAMTDMIRFTIGMSNSLNGSIQRAAALSAVLKLVLGFLGAIVAVKVISFFATLAVNIASTVKATLALAAGMSPVLVAFASLGALVAGLEIGRFLNDEFKIVRVAGKETAIFLLKSWENFKLGFEGIIIVLSSVWENFVDDAKIIWKELLFLLSDGFGSLNDFLPKDVAEKLGIGAASEELRQAAEAINVSNKTVADRITEKLDDLAEQAKQTEKSIKILEQVSKDLDAEIEKEFGGRQSKGQSFTEFVSKDLAKVKDILKGMNEELNLTSKASVEIEVALGKLPNALEDIPPGVRDVTSATDEASEAFKRLEQAAKSVGDSFASSLEKAVFEGGNLKEIINELGRDIAKTVFKATVTAPLSGAISGGLGGLFGGAGAGVGGNGGFPGLGGTGAGGQLLPFANGGVISSPRTFGMSGGRTGLAGEAGPEGILPLRRNSRGQLGVVNSGSGGGNTTNIVMNVKANDAASFKKSKSQILSDLRSGMGRA